MGVGHNQPEQSVRTSNWARGGADEANGDDGETQLAGNERRQTKKLRRILLVHVGPPQWSDRRELHSVGTAGRC
ncbi:hypothetical protein ACOSQ2_019698 [Xanthoceras sorbifolium]